jgi:hypothetical protein
MKPTRLLAWIQRYKILGRIAAGGPLDLRDAWRKHHVFLTALLIASLGLNLWQARVAPAAKGWTSTAASAKRTTSVSPSSSEPSYYSGRHQVLHMPDYEYWFQWQRGDQSKGEWGDVLSLYNTGDAQGTTPVYRTLLGGTFISEIAPWTIPNGDDREGPNAFMVVSHYSTGSSMHYAIFAEIQGRIRQVLDVNNGHAWYSSPLEVVDLDRDGSPEIISVDDYRLIDSGEKVARVWKWSKRRDTYVQVRASTYAGRLKPLPEQADTF